MKTLIKISKFIHKWIGLLLALFLAYMSITGIILNHPVTFSEIDAPQSITPEQYQLSNWNRSSLIGLVRETDSLEFPAYAFGNNGVYKIHESGKVENIMKVPFPESAWNMKTKTAVMISTSEGIVLLAGTFDGLFSYNIEQKKWRKIGEKGESKKIIKILAVEDSIFAFSDSEIYTANIYDMKFTSSKLLRKEKEPRRTVLELFFELHTGEAWGLPGKLLFDAVAVILFFLSVSAFYIWLFPKKRNFDSKRNKKHSIKQLAVYKFFMKYHLKLGMYAFVFMLIIGATGLFMRPPLVGVILSGSFPEKYYPGLRSENKFHGKIRNAMYDKLIGRFILDTKDGVWVQTAGSSNHYMLANLPVPIFAMGATVFEQEKNGDYLIGSFSGLFRINPMTGKISDAINGGGGSAQSLGRPSENLVTGYFRANDGTEYISSHFSGLACIGGELDARYDMPQKIADHFELSLWNYCFELHNARFFADWIGNWYILVIPLCSILFLILTITGVIDWLWRKRRKFSRKL